MKRQTDSIDKLLLNYSKTQLTQTEAGILFASTKNYVELVSLENVLSSQHKEPSLAIRQDIRRELLEIKKNLDDLEGIQFKEGRQMTQLSNRSLGMNAFLSKLELAFLIVNGAVILYMVLLGTNLMGKVN